MQLTAATCRISARNRKIDNPQAESAEEAEAAEEQRTEPPNEPRRLRVG